MSQGSLKAHWIDGNKLDERLRVTTAEKVDKELVLESLSSQSQTTFWFRHEDSLINETRRKNVNKRTSMHYAQIASMENRFLAQSRVS